MAIKIDLLPGHVKQRRNLELAIAASVLTLALVGTGLAMAYDAKQKELKTARRNLEIVTEVAAKTTAAKEAQTIAETATAPINDTVGFMLAASKSGPQRAALLSQVSKYVYEDTLIKSIDLSDGKQAVIVGSVKNPDEYARFLFNLRRGGPPVQGDPTEGGPLFAQAPVAQGVKGFGNGYEAFVPPQRPTDQPLIIRYPLDVSAAGPLKYPIPVVPDPVSATAAPGGQPGGPGGFGGPGGPGGGPGGPTPGASPASPGPGGPTPGASPGGP